jgi:hypothetical protein
MGKGSPFRSRPIAKSEFRQILPDRSNLGASLAFIGTTCLSKCRQFAASGRCKTLQTLFCRYSKLIPESA